ncbi:MAG: acyltransferase [Candidatus Omnitrophota bacterium]
MIGEILKRVKFWLNEDRLGPDMPLTHICLYFPSCMRRLCNKKFKRFGRGAEFRPGAYAFGCSKIEIGDNVVIRPGSVLAADTRQGGQGIVIEDNVLLGSCVHFYCHNHQFEDPDVPIIEQGYGLSQKVVLKNGCWIGANTVFLKGVTVGAHSVVGAGSIVTRDIPDGVVAAGNPAHVIRRIGERKTDTFDICSEQVK